MKIQDFLYVDSLRLSSYFEQIVGSTLVADKMPTWKATLSLAGPSAEVSRSRRNATVPEMLRGVLEYLKKEGLLVTGTDRFCEDGRHTTPFRHCTFRAQKATLLSSDDEPLPGRDYLSLWISEKLPEPGNYGRRPSRRTGRYYLVESCKEDDVNGCDGLSAFSALLFLLDLRGPRQALAARIGIRDLPPIAHDDTGRHLPRLAPSAFPGRLKLKAFDQDPIGFLTEIGAHIGEARRIDAFFKQRFSSYDPATSGIDLCGYEVCYPIVITESNG